jgi:hypothetical protein
VMKASRSSMGGLSGRPGGQVKGAGRSDQAEDRNDLGQLIAARITDGQSHIFVDAAVGGAAAVAATTLRSFLNGAGVGGGNGHAHGDVSDWDGGMTVTLEAGKTRARGEARRLSFACEGVRGLSPNLSA